MPDEVRPQVSIFIPARNEAGNISPLMDKIARAFAAQNIAGEVVLVNDGSTDGTRQEAEAAATRYPFIRVISHRRPLGLTEALRTGFAAATGDVIIFLPGDLEADPEEDVPKLLDKLAEGYDVVAGWRQGRRDSKVLASTIYNLGSRILFGLDAHDMNWIKAFRREVIEDLPPLRSDWHRFILMIAASQGYRIGEVRVNYYPRQQGRSKFGFWRIPVSFLDLLVVRFLLTFSRRPMLFFGSIGSFLILSAGAISLYLLALWLTDFTQKRPVFTFSIFLASAGLLLFLVGFLAELVVSQTERLDAIEEELRAMRLADGGNQPTDLTGLGDLSGLESPRGRR
jgi:glycosyltransferase involved in cell wall biosynthesis